MSQTVSSPILWASDAGYQLGPPTGTSPCSPQYTWASQSMAASFQDKGSPRGELIGSYLVCYDHASQVMLHHFCLFYLSEGVIQPGPDSGEENQALPLLRRGVSKNVWTGFKTSWMILAELGLGAKGMETEINFWFYSPLIAQRKTSESSAPRWLSY